MLGLLALAVRRWRRGAPPALSELERALRRTRREPAPGTTLHALELRFAATPAAAGYVRALRESRYRDAAEPPDPRAAPRPAVRARTRRRPARSSACLVGPPTAVAARLTIGGMDDVYDLYQRGMALLEDGHFHQATIPLAKARDLEPDKTSIREALGRAYFRSGGFEEARAEFEAVVERAPTNDYALFCLGRSLMQLGRDAEARKPLTLAANMNPKRRDYRIYRDRARKAA